ncbi:hypothetical protein [[Mycoplasma] testudinis]|uniref:hypothetical protein n=1 Tax=[Mycoplasma] testudinis TaxID=33924 RepID=UPI000487B84D|nr:hypothetical protein [[Mycoplasma] testudinis]
MENRLVNLSYCKQLKKFVKQLSDHVWQELSLQQLVSIDDLQKDQTLINKCPDFANFIVNELTANAICGSVDAFASKYSYLPYFLFSSLVLRFFKPLSIYCEKKLPEVIAYEELPAYLRYLTHSQNHH